MAAIPHSNRLRPETAYMLHALEAFLNDPPIFDGFRCICCHNHVAYEYQFIQDLHPFSTTYLLFDDVDGVMFGADNRPNRGIYVGEYPAGCHVDMVSVYCASCGTWVGWKIIWLYENYHPVIRPSRYILTCGGGSGVGIEAVFY